MKNTKYDTFDNKRIQGQYNRQNTQSVIHFGSQVELKGIPIKGYGMLTDE